MELKEEIKLYQQLRFEQDGRVKEPFDTLSEENLYLLLSVLKKEEKHPNEPNALKEIISQSVFGELSYPVTNIDDRIKGAIVGRFAGCLLGVPVEGYSIERMEKLAQEYGTPFPAIEYWHKVDREDWIQYGVDIRGNYTLNKINAVFVDDDITYTVLNLELLDKYGAKYTVNDVAKLWLEKLPYGCTAEEMALANLHNGVKPEEVANDNPFVEWIGGAIRADAFGYTFAGRPHLAAISSYSDAFLTHRRNGIYGEMYLAAAISLSFVMHPFEALKKAMDYIPSKSRLHQALEWAFSKVNDVKDFKQARSLIDEKFPGMDSVHTINNMCVLVFASKLGQESYTSAVSTCVAMGLDNDCTGASIGSMFGAYYGLSNIEDKWYKCFNNTVHTYLIGEPVIPLDSLFDLTIKLYNKNKKTKKQNL